MFEDIITVREGTTLKLYVSKTAVGNTSAWWQDTFQFAVQTLELRCICMHSILCFRCGDLFDTEHQCITAGTTSLSDLEKKFNRNDGFHISFNGVSKSTVARLSFLSPGVNSFQTLMTLCFLLHQLTRLGYSLMPSITRGTQAIYVNSLGFFPTK